MKKLHTVYFEKEELALVRSILTSGKHQAVVFRRAQILIKAHEGLTDTTIAEHVLCGTRMVASVRKRYCSEGLERALYDDPRSGAPATITNKDEAVIVALACTDPPDGALRWTLDLLVEKAQKEGTDMGRTKVWTILREHDLKPWREKNVVHS
jgi:transposase